MPAYTFTCDSGHDTEEVMTFSEWGEFSRRSLDAEGRVIHECYHPVGDRQCGLNAIRQFTSNDVIYNAPGFYGNIPTMAAHNSGHM